MVKIIGRIKVNQKAKPSKAIRYEVKRTNRNNHSDVTLFPEYGKMLKTNCQTACDLLNKTTEKYYFFPSIYRER